MLRRTGLRSGTAMGLESVTLRPCLPKTRRAVARKCLSLRAVLLSIGFLLGMTCSFGVVVLVWSPVLAATAPAAGMGCGRHGSGQALATLRAVTARVGT